MGRNATKVGAIQLASIGEKIREARIQRGMTQSELSADLVTPSMISQIESDRTRPSYPLLIAIANRLSLPVEYFMNDMEDQYASMAYVQLARCYLLLGQASMALTIIQKATLPDPPGLAYQEHQLVLSEALRQAEHYEESISVIEELREHALRNQDMHLLFSVCRQAGYIEYDIENFDGAMHEWETAISVGESLELGGQFSTVKYQSDLSEIYLNLHIIYRVVGNEAAARTAIEKSLRLTQSSGRLRTIADSLVQDGLQMLDARDGSRAHDLFHRAAIVAEAARFMERAICIEAEFHRSMSGVPADPWTQAAIAATTVSPVGFLESELGTIDHLLKQGNIDETAARVNRALHLLDAYFRHDPRLEHELKVHLYRFHAMQAEVSYHQGRRHEAMMALSDVLRSLETSGLEEEWIRVAALMVQWKVDTEDFNEVVDLTSRIEERYATLHQARLQKRLRRGNADESPSSIFGPANRSN